jgi:hypothetical protein
MEVDILVCLYLATKPVQMAKQCLAANSHLTYIANNASVNMVELSKTGHHHY